MNPLTSFLFGLDKDEVPPAGESHWEFAGLPQGSWLWLAALILGLAVALIVLLYRREAALSPLRSVTLSVLRLTALALVVLILLNPKMVTEIQLELPGRTLVLMDTSGSMDQRDPLQSDELAVARNLSGIESSELPSRGKIALASLETHDILPRLAEKNRVHLYSFDQDVSEIKEIDSIRPTSFNGEETLIGRAVVDVLQRFGPDPVAGVVLLSDGRDNSSVHPFELIRPSLARKQVPIHVVALGKYQEFQNFSVPTLNMPRSAELGFPIQIEAGVRLSGIPGEVKVSLLRNKEVIEQRDLVATGGDELIEIKFIDTVLKKGTYRYTIEVPVHPQEKNLHDNRRSSNLLATEKNYRVFFASGHATPEYLAIRDFLLRDHGLASSCLLMSADSQYPQNGDIRIEKFPETSVELEEYDVIILLDPNPEGLPEDFVYHLRKFVAEVGGSLLYVAGEHYTHALSTSIRSASLLDLIPVFLEGTHPSELLTHHKPWRPLLTAAGMNHPLCSLNNDTKLSLTLWKTLPPFHYAYAASQIKPATLVLAENTSNHVIVATMQAGMGQSIYLGSDDFNNWGDADTRYPERFWAGLVRYLAESRRTQGRRRSYLETDRDRYTQRDTIQVFVHIVDTEGSSTLPSFVEVDIERLSTHKENTAVSGVHLTNNAKQPSHLRLQGDPKKPGKYKGFFRPTTIGEYLLRFEDQERIVPVRPISSEWDDTTPDFKTLEKVANASGGTFRVWRDIEELPERLPAASQKQLVGRRIATLWDSAALMLLFCGLLIAEWILRKWWQLN